MPPKVSEEYRQSTRDKILEAAESVFQRKGYHDTSMDNVVAESGLSKGAIYGYFKSKEELFENLKNRGFEINLDRARAILESNESARSKLEKVADIYFLSQNEVSREACRMSLQFSAASLQMKPVHQHLEERYQEIHSLLAILLKEGVRRGEFRKGIDVDSIASLLIATVDGLTLRWATLDAEINWRKIKDALTDLVFDGVSSR